MAKILAVDDSASMRSMVAFTLRGAGHDVAEAENGQHALDTAKAGAFQLVLADVNMPVMDGITLVRELRALPAYAGVPILILTTESHADKKMEGKQAGATGWLVKPFDPDQLLATVNRVLG
ncbi:response regulator [Oleiagrimonas sp. C23AA]|uniref:response regulator n=1 Tax=Oleiagrimonas sp. C23AA TaxID=2719047 RepID=UPI001420BB95|nr:response regulator [Oleiagrimonas sp. C23AA]NII09225.1 response regulator [Oleiagrimonas sp. C23AA]